MSEKKENSGFVSWTIFVWAMGIILGIFAWGFTFILRSDAKVDAFNQDSLEIKVQLSQIQADLIWIKNNLNN